MSEDKPKLDWSTATDLEKNRAIAKYIALNDDDTEYYLNDTTYCMALSRESFKRGFRWRPDNGLLICYPQSYDEPATQIDCETFEEGTWIILLRLAGVDVKTGFLAVQIERPTTA